LFKAGAIYADANLNTTNWDKGIKRVDSSSKSISGTLKTLAKVGFAAVAAGMTAAIYKANEYQKAFRNVSTLTDQTTGELQDMSLGLLRLDSSLGSTTELTRAMYDAISAGAKPGKQAFETVESAAKFAKAAMADNAASVRLLSATVNAYGSMVDKSGKKMYDSEKAANIFFKTIKLGVVTGEQLSATIGDSIPLFASMNIPVEQLASGLAAMTKQGVNSAEATTQLNAIVNAFLKPSTDLTKVLKEQGYESGQAFIQSQGLTGALDVLKTATESGKYETADLVKNIRGMKGVLALSGQGAEIYNDTLNEMADASGAVDTAFAKQEKTFATLKTELGKTAIIVGNIGKSFTDKIAGGAQSALEAINEFILGQKGLETFSNIAAKVGGAFQVIKEFATEVYDLFAENLNETITELKEEFDDLFSSSMDQGAVFDALSVAVNLLGAGFNIIVAVTKLVIKYWLNLISIGIDIAKTFKSVWDVITGKAEWGDVKDSLMQVKDGYVKLGKDLIDDTKNVIGEAKEQWNTLTKNAEDNSETFAEAWEKGSKNASDAVRNNYKAAVTGVKNNSDEILDIIENQNEKTNELNTIGAETSNEATKTGLDTNKTLWDEWKTYVENNLNTTLEKFRFWADQVISLVRETYSGLSNISNQFFTNERAKLENQYKNGEIGEKEYQKKLNDIKKKQFETQKAFNLTNILINVAGGVASAYNPYIPFVSEARAGIVVGMGIAQTSLVAQQQFVPEYAEGTDYHSGGMALVGEEGPELVNLPRGTSVIPNDITENMMAGKGIEININNPVVRQDSDINRIANAVSQVLGRQLQVA